MGTPAPTPSGKFKCKSNQCVASATGVSLEVCNSICGSASKYKCKGNQCVVDADGVSLEICEAVCGGPSPSPTPSPTPPTPSPPATCVKHEVLTCINDYSSYWPKCDPSQSKTNSGPSGYEFGHYCTEAWTEALNEML